MPRGFMTCRFSVMFEQSRLKRRFIKAYVTSLFCRRWLTTHARTCLA